MVAIKDMDMPKDCWKCELISETTSGLTICGITGDTLKSRNIKDTRLESCPLIEIVD